MITLGIDAHKRTHTVAVDGGLGHPDGDAEHGPRPDQRPEGAAGREPEPSEPMQSPWAR